MTTEYFVAFEGVVKITIDDDSDAITRCTENIDGWRDNLYDLRTREQVLEHLAFNCVANDVEDATRLDGWADIDADTVVMVIERDTLEFDCAN
jgi:hypothetical protein